MVMTTRVMTPNNNDNNRDDTNNDNNNGDDNNVEDNNNDNNNGDDDNLLSVGVVSVPKLAAHPLRHRSTLCSKLLQLMTMTITIMSRSCYSTLLSIF